MHVKNCVGIGDIYKSYARFYDIRPNLTEIKGKIGKSALQKSEGMVKYLPSEDDDAKR